MWTSLDDKRYTLSSDSLSRQALSACRKLRQTMISGEDAQVVVSSGLGVCWTAAGGSIWEESGALHQREPQCDTSSMIACVISAEGCSSRYCICRNDRV